MRIFQRILSTAPKLFNATRRDKEVSAMPPKTAAPTTWTTPEDLALQVRRLWDQGRILASGLTGEPLFPLALRLRRPTTRQLSDEFDSVRAWIRALEEGAKPAGGLGYEIVWEEINNRRLGRNRAPSGAVVATKADALALIGKAKAAARFDVLAQAAIKAAPELGGWLARKPLTALEHAADWERILAVLAWFRTHPRCGLYLRQVDIPGIDTKFIETRKGLLAELLDLTLPPGAIDEAITGIKGFEARYGLRTKPPLVRFRILDRRQALSGLTDLTVPAEHFASLEPSARRVFVTENEVNGLAFPDMEDSLVVFGLGYGLGLLSNAAWLRSREIHYWGDIDTHGFAMLDTLRSRFPHAQSLLMDRETLDAHWNLRCEEDSPCAGSLDLLTPAEGALYDELRFDRLGRRVRLEQERVAFGWAQRALNACAV
jgi:hypothetical protein